MSCASFPRDGSPWTDQRTQRLTDLWRAGKSAREVADALGVTRNAVIGKLHRLGLSGDPAHASARPSKPRRERRPRAVVVRSPATRRRIFVCQAEALPGLAPHLEDLSRRALFEQIERPALQPLPQTRYEFAIWKPAKVNIDYHIEFADRYYSVPHQSTCQLLTVPIWSGRRRNSSRGEPASDRRSPSWSRRSCGRGTS